MTQHVMESGPLDRHDRLMEFSANTDPITKLRFVLTANATTSGLAGLTALVAGERVDSWLDTAHSGWVRVIGAGLAVFALAVIALSRSNEQSLRRWVPPVTLADGGWVAASIATIIAGWYSNGGAAILGVIAAIVGTFAIAQMRLLRTRSAAPTPSPGLTAPRERCG
jgi:hypothetical protein